MAGGGESDATGSALRVVIIGGGIAGTSAAAALARHCNVTLLEQETSLGYHASGRSAAMFEENYGNDAVRALNRASKAEHERMDVLSPRGLMMVALENEQAVFEADLGSMGMVEVPVAEARRLVPILNPDIVRAGLHEGASDIDTDRLLNAYARDARNHGATLVTGARVVGIEKRAPPCPSDPPVHPVLTRNTFEPNSLTRFISSSAYTPAGLGKNGAPKQVENVAAISPSTPASVEPTFAV